MGNFSGFQGSSGKKYADAKPVVPLMLMKDSKWVVIGTAFYISSIGVLVTARHCVEECTRRGTIEGVAIIHLSTEVEGQYYIRPIVKAWWSQTADIAVLLAAPMHNSDGMALPTSVLRVSIERPPPGTIVASYTFPETAVTYEGGKSVIKLTPRLIEGRLLDYHPSGRDSSFITWPVYRTDLDIRSGASGGPVFSDRGTVFAVNTTSFDYGGDAAPLSYITPIDYILDAHIPNVSIDGEPAVDLSVRDLAHRGFIQFSPDFPTE